MQAGTLEISQNGVWIPVPALEISGTSVIIQGRWLKVASVHDETWMENELDNPSHYVAELKRVSALPADIFTFGQKVPDTFPKYSYPMEVESTAVARLNSFKEWWDGLPQETRKNVRRAHKRGVTVSVRQLDDDIIRGLMELNNEAPMIQGKANRHYGKTFEQVKRDYSSFLDRSDLVAASFNGELIGLVKLVYRGEVASILQCLSKSSHYDKRPANALLAKTFELCEQKRVRFVTYGQYRYGNKSRSPFLEFKTRHGFEEMLIPRFYAPLSAWGSFCVASKLYRRPSQILPANIVDAAAGLRSKWYLLKRSAKPV